VCKRSNSCWKKSKSKYCDLHKDKEQSSNFEEENTMFTTITLIALLGYIGDIAFVIGGVLAAKKLKLHWTVQLLSGLSTAFFGGLFLRDIFLLKTTPAIFNSPVEFTATALIGVLTIIFFRKKTPSKIFNWTLCLIDSIGIAGFAVAGYERGIKASVIIALACGFVTACGGGIIAAVIRTVAKKSVKNFFKTLAENRWYYLFGISMSIAYGILNLMGKKDDTVLILLTVIAVIIGFFIEGNKSAHGQCRP
jgi:uncharacterized membrane protein YeiH